MIWIAFFTSIMLQISGMLIVTFDLLPQDVNALYGGCAILAGILLGIYCLLEDEDGLGK
jgi:hypothetical protein